MKKPRPVILIVEPPNHETGRHFHRVTRVRAMHWWELLWHKLPSSHQPAHPTANTLDRITYTVEIPTAQFNQLTGAQYSQDQQVTLGLAPTESELIEAYRDGKRPVI